MTPLALSLMLLGAVPAEEALEAFISGSPVQSAQDPVSMEFGGDFLLPQSPDLAEYAILRQFHRSAFGLPPDHPLELSEYIGSVWQELSTGTRNLWREFAGAFGLPAPEDQVTPENLTSLLRYCSATGSEPPDVDPDDLTDLQRYYYVLTIPDDELSGFLHDPFWAVRQAVIQRNPSLAFEILDDPSPAVRMMAAKACGRADILLDMSSVDGPIGHMSLSGVGQIPILEDSLYRSEDPAKRASALLAMLELGWRIPEERADFLLTDDYLMVRAITADALGRDFAMPGGTRDLQGVSPPEAVVLVTDAGEYTMELFNDLAPVTCMNFWHLAESGFYDSIYFHRVLPGFVAQAGCPEGNGYGGPGYTIPAENNTAPYERGTVGMADSGMDTGGSQFFIMLDSQRRLDCRYTAFARILNTEGIKNIQIGTRILEIRRANP